MHGKTIVNRKNFFSEKMTVLILLCLFLVCRNLYAGGNSEDTEIKPLYTTWTLCLTRFDTSALPPEKQIIGNIVTKNISDQLSSLGARIRPPEETAYYSEYFWSQARLEAAQKIKSKRDERDALLFRGDTDYNYKNKIKKIDEEIKALEETFYAIEADYPLVAEQPAFSLSEQNLSGTYPEVPKNGMEYSFCKEQKIDGFLNGTVSEYYGRIYISIKLYTLYTQSYMYEDIMLFSVEDQQMILAELSGRLKSVLSGIEPAAIMVKAEPEDAIILMNESYAGRGTVTENALVPETVNVEVFADEYQSANIQVDLFSGELTEMFFNLQPIAYQAFNIDTVNGFPASVYLGSTFMGMTPLTLQLLPNQYEYVTMENEKDETASFVYNGKVASAVITLKPEIANTKTVEDYRKSFYGAYGRFWISLPIAFLVYGISSSMVNSSNYSGKPDMYDGALTSQYVFYGTAGVAGAFLIETLVRMGIYLYQSNKANVAAVK